MSPHPTLRQFGFIEFRTVAECNSCVALNNIELGGKQAPSLRPLCSGSYRGTWTAEVLPTSIH